LVRGSIAIHRKTHVLSAAEAGAQFIHLEVREVQMAEEVHMQGVCMHGLPATERRVLVACRKPKTREAAEGSSPSESRREHHGDLGGRRFQSVQGRVTSRTEGGVARLTPERLNPLGLAMLAISDEGMEGGVGVAEVRATLGWGKRTLRC
jgi:hypothetical protein